MNYIGHHEVARRIEPDRPEVLFGALIPDLAGMFKVKKSYKRAGWEVTNPEIRRGIQLHKLTNDAFDSHPEVQRIGDAIKTDLLPVLGNGLLALQCTNAGKDMLFDGLFLDMPDAIASFQATICHAANGKIDASSAVEDYELFSAGIRAFAEQEIPRYDDPSVVADRIIRRLSGMRSTVKPETATAISEVFAHHTPALSDVGNTVLFEVVTTVAQ